MSRSMPISFFLWNLVSVFISCYMYFYVSCYVSFYVSCHMSFYVSLNLSFYVSGHMSFCLLLYVFLRLLLNVFDVYFYLSFYVSCYMSLAICPSVPIILNLTKEKMLCSGSVESNLVKLKTSRTVIIPPMTNVLLLYTYVIKTTHSCCRLNRAAVWIEQKWNWKRDLLGVII